MKLNPTQHEIICHQQGEIAQLTKERDKALAKCAEMASALERQSILWDNDKNVPTHCWSVLADLAKRFSANECGKGFVRVTELEPTRELLNRCLSTPLPSRKAIRAELARLEKLVKEVGL